MEVATAKPIPHRTKLKGGRKYRWCMCGLSQRQPFCDEAHRTTDKDALPFSVEEDITVALCGCKLSAQGPYCDGAHACNDQR